MSGPLAYLNGKFLPRAEAVLPIHDAGLVFGAAVTDFSRTFRHQLFRWPDHLERFLDGCRACYIPLAVDPAALTAAAYDLVAHNAGLIEPDQELALVMFATPGPFGFYAGELDIAGPTLCLHTTVLPWERYRRFFTQGIDLAAVFVHPSAVCSMPPPRVKHRSRMHWWIADHTARMIRYPQLQRETVNLALLVSADGLITETAVGNLLVVHDGGVFSPPRDTVLDGVSLRMVEELCGQLGIPFARESLNLADCASADEALLCGSAFCLAGVRSINGWELSWPGPVTLRLLAAWGERVGLDVAGQFVSGRRLLDETRLS